MWWALALVVTSEVVAGPPSKPQPAPASSYGCLDGKVAPGNHTWELELGKFKREFRVHVPQSYTPGRPAPMVVAFHGFNSDPSEFIPLIKLNDVAEDAGFIAVYPEATRGFDVGGYTMMRGWNAGICCGEQADRLIYSRDIDDVEFTRKVIDVVEKRLCIDRKREFAFGYSNGGMFVQRLACEMSDKFAAATSVSGSLVFKGCRPARAMPLLMVHGNADDIVPYGGGGIVNFAPAPKTANEWARRNRCSNERVVTEKQGKKTCQRWSGCKDSSEVIFCTLDGQKHEWPTDGSQQAWNFFRAHPMR